MQNLAYTSSIPTCEKKSQAAIIKKILNLSKMQNYFDGIDLEYNPNIFDSFSSYTQPKKRSHQTKEKKFEDNLALYIRHLLKKIEPFMTSNIWNGIEIDYEQFFENDEFLSMFKLDFLRTQFNEKSAKSWMVVVNKYYKNIRDIQNPKYSYDAINGMKQQNINFKNYVLFIVQSLQKMDSLLKPN